MNSSSMQQKIDDIINKYVPGVLPGTAILVGNNGKIIFNKGYGMADIEKNVPVTTDTAFMIASITKQFTDMAIMILKERGYLEYDEIIDKYFEDFPSYINKITIRHLMTHTSGIPDYFTDEFIKKAVKSDSEMTQDDVLEEIKGFSELEFEPGTGFSYSNSGYVMLGYIIEKISGLTFDEFLYKNIFQPLNMQRTIVGTSEKHIKGAAFGYIRDESNIYQSAPYNRTIVGWADGNMVTTAEDLFKWHNALYTEKLVKKETLKEAFTSYILKNGTVTNYGFGWFIYCRRGLKEIWHSGGTVGFTCRFSRFVDNDIAIIMLTNLDPQNAKNVTSIFGEITEVVLEDKLSSIKTKDLSAYELQYFVGTYTCKIGKCRIFYDGIENKLLMKSDIERFDEEIKLTPTDNMEFRMDSPAEYYLKFIENEGKNLEMEINLHGRIIRLKSTN